ncbi:hypothetical protein ACWKSP_14175 [Micromonosporaceae bacterium Da 78-11]
MAASPLLVLAAAVTLGRRALPVAKARHLSRLLRTRALRLLTPSGHRGRHRCRPRTAPPRAAPTGGGP